ncbi:tyrosine-type recombinase/integrase [Verrucomicrobiales bacterium BCK34]|nr:tyrosine-type recombinase/integrase [Verrucomicrobiales bacterium BCK34]
MQTRFSKTDPRYWKTKVTKAKGKNFYGVQIQHCGERHYLSLGTGNKDEAGSRAVKLYLDVRSKGWESVMEEQRPTPTKKAATIGAYLDEAERVAEIEPRTLNEYRKALRRIVSGIMEVDGAGRYDWRNGKNEEWRNKVDSIKLDAITPRKIQTWIKRELDAAGSDPARQRAKKNTLNGIIRNAKSLFGQKVLPFVEQQLEIPDPHPLKEIRFFPRQSMRYLSKIKPEKVIEKAVEELATPRKLSESEVEDYINRYVETMTVARRKRKCAGEFVLSKERRATLPGEAHRCHEQMECSRREQWKILALALCAGLRFEEIDKLLWSQVDLENGTIRIDYTPYFRPKTEDTVGEVLLDAEVIDLLRGWKARATGEFVIEADRVARPRASYNAYRARTHQKHLLDWLRNLEFDGMKPLEHVQKPIHELRKEAGSMVNAAHGIHAASSFLRHSDLRVTAAHYLDQRNRVTTGIGGLLKPSNVVEFTGDSENPGHDNLKGKTS